MKTNFLWAALLTAIFFQPSVAAADAGKVLKTNRRYIELANCGGAMNIWRDTKKGGMIVQVCMEDYRSCNSISFFVNTKYEFKKMYGRNITETHNMTKGRKSNSAKQTMKADKACNNKGYKKGVRYYFSKEELNGVGSKLNRSRGKDRVADNFRIRVHRNNSFKNSHQHDKVRLIFPRKNSHNQNR